MAFFPIIVSETEFVICPEPDLATFANEMYHVDWTPITVESTVTRGKHLRECKPTSPPEKEIPININYIKPCMENKRSNRNCHNPCYDIYNPCPPCPPCDCCPQTSIEKSKPYKRSKTSLTRHKQCPLRIMELAAPTKRHCLDTWRSKSHILPDIMVERIRQHVMDERPLVPIPDAINCFKKRVTHRSSSSKSCRRRLSNSCMADMRKFSAMFAYCVARKLEKPLNITLNPQLEKISRVISYEMSSVTKKNNKRLDTKSKRNKFEAKIQDEMAKKVTAWIDNVLADTSDKLLEDDLMELEEKEGPVLDLIDELIDDVVASCEPVEEYNSGEVTGNVSVADIESEKSDILYENDTINGDDEDGNNLSKENSTNELDHIDELTSDTNLDIKTNYTNIPSENSNNPTDGVDAETDELNTEGDLTGEINNVSETFKKYSEESLDEKNLTMKFSNLDNAGGGIGTSETGHLNDSEDNTLPINHHHAITFAPPNEHLLSDADESWPADIPKVTQKPSAVVSQSVTTLGYLDENEEKNILKADGDSKTITTHDTNTNDIKIGDAVDTLHKIEREEMEVQQTNYKGDAEISNGFTAKDIEKLKCAITDQSRQTGDDMNETDFPERKVDYKVDARTAPSWVLTGHCDTGCGEPEDCLPERRTNDAYEISEKELRIWSKNLEITCDNLQIWHDWIKITCKTVRHNKRRSERYRSCRANACRQKNAFYWIKLNKYINRDSEYWLKFKKSKKRRLRKYKYIYRHRTKLNGIAVNSIKCICEKTNTT